MATSADVKRSIESLRDAFEQAEGKVDAAKPSAEQLFARLEALDEQTISRVDGLESALSGMEKNLREIAVMDPQEDLGDIQSKLMHLLGMVREVGLELDALSKEAKGAGDAAAEEEQRLAEVKERCEGEIEVEFNAISFTRISEDRVRLHGEERTNRAVALVISGELERTNKHEEYGISLGTLRNWVREWVEAAIEKIPIQPEPAEPPATAEPEPVEPAATVEPVADAADNGRTKRKTREEREAERREKIGRLNELSDRVMADQTSAEDRAAAIREVVASEDRLAIEKLDRRVHSRKGRDLVPKALAKELHEALLDRSRVAFDRWAKQAEAAGGQQHVDKNMNQLFDMAGLKMTSSLDVAALATQELWKLKESEKLKDRVAGLATTLSTKYKEIDNDKVKRERKTLMKDLGKLATLEDYADKGVVSVDAEAVEVFHAAKVLEVAGMALRPIRDRYRQLAFVGEGEVTMTAEKVVRINLADKEWKKKLKALVEMLETKGAEDDEQEPEEMLMELMGKGKLDLQMEEDRMEAPEILATHQAAEAIVAEVGAELDDANKLTRIILSDREETGVPGSNSVRVDVRSADWQTELREVVAATVERQKTSTAQLEPKAADAVRAEILKDAANEAAEKANLDEMFGAYGDTFGVDRAHVVTGEQTRLVYPINGSAPTLEIDTTDDLYGAHMHEFAFRYDLGEMGIAATDIRQTRDKYAEIQDIEVLVVYSGGGTRMLEYTDASRPKVQVDVASRGWYQSLETGVLPKLEKRIEKDRVRNHARHLNLRAKKSDFEAARDALIGYALLRDTEYTYTASRAATRLKNHLRGEERDRVLNQLYHELKAAAASSAHAQEVYHDLLKEAVLLIPDAGFADVLAVFERIEHNSAKEREFVTHVIAGGDVEQMRQMRNIVEHKTSFARDEMLEQLDEAIARLSAAAPDVAAEPSAADSLYADIETAAREAEAAEAEERARRGVEQLQSEGRLILHFVRDMPPYTEMAEVLQQSQALLGPYEHHFDLMTLADTGSTRYLPADRAVRINMAELNWELQLEGVVERDLLPLDSPADRPDPSSDLFADIAAAEEEQRRRAMDTEDIPQDAYLCRQIMENQSGFESRDRRVAAWRVFVEVAHRDEIAEFDRDIRRRNPREVPSEILFGADAVHEERDLRIVERSAADASRYAQGTFVAPLLSVGRRAVDVVAAADHPIFTLEGVLAGLNGAYCTFQGPDLDEMRAHVERRMREQAPSAAPPPDPAWAGGPLPRPDSSSPRWASPPSRRDSSDPFGGPPTAPPPRPRSPLPRWDSPTPRPRRDSSDPFGGRPTASPPSRRQPRQQHDPLRLRRQYMNAGMRVSSSPRMNLLPIRRRPRERIPRWAKVVAPIAAALGIGGYALYESGQPPEAPPPAPAKAKKAPENVRTGGVVTGREELPGERKDIIHDRDHEKHARRVQDFVLLGPVLRSHVQDGRFVSLADRNPGESAALYAHDYARKIALVERKLAIEETFGTLDYEKYHGPNVAEFEANKGEINKEMERVLQKYFAGADIDMMRTVMYGICAVESTCNPKKRNTDGAKARGLGGISVVAARSVRMRHSEMNKIGPNLEATARYLSKMLKLADGRIDVALLAYTFGPTKTRRLIQQKDSSIRGWKDVTQERLDKIGFNGFNLYQQEVGLFARDFNDPDIAEAGGVEAIKEAYKPTKKGYDLRQILGISVPGDMPPSAFKKKDRLKLKKKLEKLKQYHMKVAYPMRAIALGQIFEIRAIGADVSIVTPKSRRWTDAPSKQPDAPPPGSSGVEEGDVEGAEPDAPPPTE